MAKRAHSEIAFPPFSAELQIRFWARLQLIQKQFFFESLSAAVKDIDIVELDRELAEYAGSDKLAAVAAYAMRGETFFAVPCILLARPRMLGYYRLLYGISQKEFYKRPYSRFRTLETQDQLSTNNRAVLPELCRSLNETAWRLFNGIQPVSLSTIHDLQLLTIGPQLRGSENNTIGQGAVKDVFQLVAGLVATHVESRTETVITLKNAAGRVVRIAFAPDPDIAIVELLPSGLIPSVSIEIKGGTDVSNVHNRMGEAEKSHQKAKSDGFTRFWTVLRANIDLTMAKRESPTTTEFFRLEEILRPGTTGHLRFRDLLFQATGIG